MSDSSHSNHSLRLVWEWDQHWTLTQLLPDKTPSSAGGKSAIMSAIVVALGGKAAYTHVGSSLRQFIRTGCRWGTWPTVFITILHCQIVFQLTCHGKKSNYQARYVKYIFMFCPYCSSAKVIVYLRNRGTKAYRPDVYGCTIVVERGIGFYNTGRGRYRMKSMKGCIVSERKEELISILDHFNIQVGPPSHRFSLVLASLIIALWPQIDNPASFLHQNVSQNFLNPSAMYKVRTLWIERSWGGGGGGSWWNINGKTLAWQCYSPSLF